MYTKLSETESLIEALKDDGGKITFRLNSKEQDFAAVFVEADEEMIAEEKSRAQIHLKLIDLFDNQLDKIEIFENCIASDPSKGYMHFVSENLI